MHLPLNVLRILKERYPDAYTFALTHMAKYHETAFAKGIPLTGEADQMVGIIRRHIDFKIRKVYRGPRHKRVGRWGTENGPQSFCPRKDATSCALYRVY
jgi:hypothetical protein